jgi:hypothetical protein
MSLFSRALQWGKKRLYRWRDPAYATVVVEEFLPKNPKPRVLYIVQEDGFEEHAAMLCPCGCGELLQMNLLPDERPCWRLVRHKDGTSSLKPSVWRKKGCRSHFWLRRGRIFWFGSNDRI